MSFKISDSLLFSFRENIREILKTHGNTNKLLTNEHPTISGFIDDFLIILEQGLFSNDEENATNSNKSSPRTPITPRTSTQNNSFQGFDSLIDKKRKRWTDILGYLNLEREWRSLLKAKQTSGGVLKECLNRSIIIPLLKSISSQLTNSSLGTDLIKKHYGSKLEKCLFYRKKDLELLCNMLIPLKNIAFRLRIDDLEELERELRISKLISYGNKNGWDNYKNWKYGDGSNNVSTINGSPIATYFGSTNQIKKLNRVKLLNTKYACLLNSRQRNALWEQLPFVLQQKHWELKFSTREHQSTIQNFFSLTEDCGPTILIIQPTEGECFGLFASSSWRSDTLKKYYGDADCFLFTFNDATEENPLIIYHTTGKNDFFLFSQRDSIAVGGGGNFALWIDETFENGFSRKSKTFGNPPLISSADFSIQHCECWVFKSINENKMDDNFDAWESVISNKKTHHRKNSSTIDSSVDGNEFSDASLDALTDKTVDSIGKEYVNKLDLPIVDQSPIQNKKKNNIRKNTITNRDEEISKKLQSTPTLLSLNENLTGFSPSPIGRFTRTDSNNSITNEPRRILQRPRAIHGCLLSVRADRFKKLPKINDIDGSARYKDIHNLQSQFLKKKQTLLNSNIEVFQTHNKSDQQFKLIYQSNRSSRIHEANLKALSYVCNKDYDIHSSYQKIRQRNISKRVFYIVQSQNNDNNYNNENYNINNNSHKNHNNSNTNMTINTSHSMNANKSNEKDENFDDQTKNVEYTPKKLNETVEKITKSPALFFSLSKFAAQIERKHYILSTLNEIHGNQSYQENESNTSSHNPMKYDINSIGAGGRNVPTLSKRNKQFSTSLHHHQNHHHSQHYYQQKYNPNFAFQSEGREFNEPDLRFTPTSSNTYSNTYSNTNTNTHTHTHSNTNTNTMEETPPSTLSPQSPFSPGSSSQKSPWGSSSKDHSQTNTSSLHAFLIKGARNEILLPAATP